MNIMTTIGNFLIYSARSPENNPNININKLILAYTSTILAWHYTSLLAYTSTKLAWHYTSLLAYTSTILAWHYTSLLAYTSLY